MKKKFFNSVAVLLSSTLMLLTPFTGLADDYHFADVNRDGEVNISDINMVIDVILGHDVQPPQPTSEKYMVNGVAFTMVKVEGGLFSMGAANDDNEARPDEKPNHLVSLSPYYIGQTEVTQELWDAVMGTDPSAFTGDKKPVERVSWDDCKEFIRQLNTLTGEQFRLPTEAEWEFAARGGNKSKGYKYAGSDNINEVGWWGFEKGGNVTNYSTQPVALLAPNELGIYDMSGNVFEWCNDWYGAYPKPSIYVNRNLVIFEDIKEGSTTTSAIFTVRGYRLSDKIYINAEGDGFSVSPQVISASEANDNYITVNVTYSGPRNQLADGKIILSSENADTKIVYLRYHYPELDVSADNPLILSDVIIDNNTITRGTFTVSGKNLLDIVKVEISGEGFSIEPNSIQPVNSIVEEELVTVTYYGNSTEPVTGTIKISSEKAEEQSITVIAQKTSAPVDTTASFMMMNKIISMAMNKQGQDYDGYVEVNPTGPTSGNYHVIRGGSWNVEARFCRSSYRYNNTPDFKHYSIGFRLAK